MEYNPIKPEKNFVERTIKLAKKLKDDEYSTTLQINLLFGTIMLPKSHWYHSLKGCTVNLDEIKAVHITYSHPMISIKVLLHCLRNGLAHWRENGNQNVKFDTEQIENKNEIVKVTICGDGKVDNIHETAKIEFDVKQDGIIHFMEKIYTYLS
ncbi:HEPN family nuclease [uncultured Sphaerochaeta sp.]|uniref:HEPN family nuclease n=1 Tax=uncultured Sphaerochaeta sp. TaxID=886478 RepID=UPI002A0A63B3|nr:HEPN family nuclease [uncultured Sphaerochaeta sp.]